jgi:phosphoglycerate dehydrogenase-like enzyme
MTQIKAHWLGSDEPDFFDFLQTKLHDKVRVTFGVEVPPDVQVLVTGRVSAENLAAAPDLKAILIPWAGLPGQMGEMMADYPQVSVHNLHHNATTTGEMALTLMMSAAKNVIPLDRNFRQHDWTYRYNRAPDFVLGGQTALILGYGAIGQHVGVVCKAMGMEVLGIRRQPSDEPNVYLPDGLPELLPRANVLLVCLPGTPDTEGMIGEEEIALLPEGALVINVGRGPVIDQAALYHALKDGHLYGAGMDVWYNYPTDAESRSNTPPADFPFHELDNVVMSPHRGGGGGADEVERRRMMAVAEFLNAAARGEPMPSEVDLGRGY